MRGFQPVLLLVPWGTVSPNLNDAVGVAHYNLRAEPFAHLDLPLEDSRELLTARFNQRRKPVAGACQAVGRVHSRFFRLRMLVKDDGMDHALGQLRAHDRREATGLLSPDAGVVAGVVEVRGRTAT